MCSSCVRDREDKMSNTLREFLIETTGSKLFLILAREKMSHYDTVSLRSNRVAR